MEGFVGVTTIEVSTADVTVTVVVPDTPAKVALTVALPTALPDTTPWLGAVLLTAATDGAEETQVTNAVRFWVVPSEKSPVAMSCRLVLLAIEMLGGVIVIALSTTDVTVKVVAADTPPRVAVIVVLPTPVPVTTPLLLTVATPLEDELQLAEAVRSCLLWSEKIPVAVSCKLVLMAMEGFTGVMVSDIKVTATLSVVVPVTGLPLLLNVAEMVELPWLRPSASPLELIVATVWFDELHVT